MNGPSRGSPPKSGADQPDGDAAQRDRIKAASEFAGGRKQLLEVHRVLSPPEKSLSDLIEELDNPTTADALIKQARGGEGPSQDASDDQVTLGDEPPPAAAGSRAAADSDSQMSIDITTMKGDANRLRKRLAALNRGLINPKRMQPWDLTMLSLVVYTAIVTPFEVAFLSDGGPVLGAINWIVTSFFIVDIVTNFFLPVHDATGRFLRSYKEIALNYARLWLWMDLLSTVPIDSLVELASGPGGGGPQLRAVRMVRVLRLVKLVRILRALKSFRRLENSIAIARWKLEIMQWAVSLVICLHWLACGFGLIGSLHGTLRTPAIERAFQARLVDGGAGGVTGVADADCFGCVRGDAIMGRFCESICLTPCELEAAATLEMGQDAFSHFPSEASAIMQQIRFSEAWTCRVGASAWRATGYPSIENDPAGVWMMSLLEALILLNGNGYRLEPTNVVERAYVLVVSIVGSFLWAFLIGSISGILSTGDPFDVSYRNQMDLLNSFIRQAKVSREVAMQAREFLRASRGMLKKRSYSSVVQSLSPGLREKMWPHICGSLQDGKVHLASVWYLSTVETPLLQELTLRMLPSAFPVRETVRDARSIGSAEAPSEACLYIVEKGLVNRGGHIYYPDSGPDSCFGLDMIIQCDLLRDKRAAVSLSYVEVLALSRTDLYSMLRHYPLSAATIRNAALRLALKQATRLLRHYVSVRTARRRGGVPVRDNGAMLALMQSAFQDERDKAFADSDAGEFFRMINGNKLRKVGKNGTIVETEWVKRPFEVTSPTNSRPTSPTQEAKLPASPDPKDAASSSSSSASGGEQAPATTLLLEKMMRRMEALADEVRGLREEQRRHMGPSPRTGMAVTASPRVGRGEGAGLAGSGGDSGAALNA